MLEKQDYQEIARLMKVIVDSEVSPQLKALAEGQQMLLETLAPKSRI